MKVQCLKKYPSEEQIIELGKNFYANQGFYVEVGEYYTVLAVFIYNNQPAFGSGCWIQVVSKDEHLINAPLCLFQVIDGTLSRFWEISVNQKGTVCFCPPSFLKEYYYDDLSEGVKEIRNDFNRIKNLILNEDSAV